MSVAAARLLNLQLDVMKALGSTHDVNVMLRDTLDVLVRGLDCQAGAIFSVAQPPAQPLLVPRCGFLSDYEQPSTLVSSRWRHAYTAPQHRRTATTSITIAASPDAGACCL